MIWKPFLAKMSFSKIVIDHRGSHWAGITIYYGRVVSLQQKLLFLWTKMFLDVAGWLKQ
jgi:hypothetical protein